MRRRSTALRTRSPSTRRRRGRVRQPATASSGASAGAPTCMTQPRNQGPSASRATCGAYSDRPSSTRPPPRIVSWGVPSGAVDIDPTAATVCSSWLSRHNDTRSTQEPSTSTSCGHSQISAGASRPRTGSSPVTHTRSNRQDSRSSQDHSSTAGVPSVRPAPSNAQRRPSHSKTNGSRISRICAPAPPRSGTVPTTTGADQSSRDGSDAYRRQTVLSTGARDDARVERGDAVAEVEADAAPAAALVGAVRRRAEGDGVLRPGREVVAGDVPPVDVGV